MKPGLRIIARAHSDGEVEHLLKLGISDVVMGERELAAKMLTLALTKA
jgi:CPA2 family monovalent cation:H+ antiporter-2